MNTENIILITFSSIGTFMCIFSGICAYLKHQEENELTKELIEKV